MDLIAAKVKSPDIRISVLIMSYDVGTYQGNHSFTNCPKHKRQFGEVRSEDNDSGGSSGKRAFVNFLVEIYGGEK